MKNPLNKHQVPIALAIGSAVLGALLSNYLTVTWSAAVAISLGTVAFLIFRYFTGRFDGLVNKLGGLETHLLKLQEAVGSVGGSKMSWTEFWGKVQLLQAKIDDSDYKPEIVLGIGRSGSVVGGLIATNLALKCVALDRVHVVEKEPDGPSRRDVKIDETLVPNRTELQGKNVLCVMSECETGNTLSAIYEYLLEKCSIKARTAVVFTKRNVIFEPHYWVEMTDEDWPELPFRTPRWIPHHPQIRIEAEECAQ